MKISLKKNIIANYASQVYVTLIGILILPMYIKYMGAEAYGLIGFFAMLQTWFNLLDLGLTPTIARETSRFRGGSLDAHTYRQLVRALEGIFFAIAMIGGITLFLSSDYIANDWLKASLLPTDEVRIAIQLMSVIIAMRWMCGLYRGIISGSERLVLLSGFNSFVATVRFIGILPILIFISASPVIFFWFQMGVAIFELLGLVFLGYHLLPSTLQGDKTPWSWSPIKPILKFSLTIAFTSSVWVLVTQTDKLVLSKILPLAEYGYFTLAVLVASAVMMVSGPISTAIMPRMAKLEAEGEYEQVVLVYRKATQFVAIIAGSVSIIMCLYAEPLLFAWTGDSILAQKAAPILGLYAIGNGVLAVSAFPYYLQYAKGDLRLHLIGNAIFVVLLIPLIIWAANNYGGVGAGWVWLGMNLLAFVAWLPIIHRKFVPGLNLPWYSRDVLVIFTSSFFSAYLLKATLPLTDGRGELIAEILIIGMITMLVAILSSSEAWAMGKMMFKEGSKGA